ncbi:class II aldolase/adducin family protein [Sporosarcina thermotolerans]|uniref:Class II aldolase/adducin family protein n=1 Tax=Sporosarcina thermotolerans TaxID=633404 RepID=A0AAW9A8K2_9BACL|nr:class II aldolase/adducin family protein [Sporosarcina thermotolerans]MDW0116200.1 class II aldolase/adducin family protein [Sporosarcina thermotolerans]WHT48176.1 class II aldolase/adducin family protein [Sporosarcina thermotolerans]
MNKTLDEKFDDAIWVAHSLFNRGKASGSIANLSFKHEDKIYITATGTCFGTLKRDEFAVIDLEGNPFNELKPSKELPMHLAIFKAKPDVEAVVHVHSTYSVLWSFVPGLDEEDCIPDHTPYLKMKLGTVGLVPYEKPGSKELFHEFDKRVNTSDGWLLAQHGPVAPGKSILEAFFALEELEESAQIAWELRNRL